MSENNFKIAIIGFGHIGHSIYSGLVKSGISKDDIFTSKSDEDNLKIAENADIIFICVKPKKVNEVIEKLRAVLSGKIIISVAACVDMKLLEKYSGMPSPKIVRLMPNVPVTYGEGVVGYFANKNLTVIDSIELKKLIERLGYIVECKNDDDVDRIGMISGSGTGYVAYFMENLNKVAKSYGFNDQDAKKIVLNTFAGTIRHISETEIHFHELVSEVATKGGITEEVINNLEKKKYFPILKSGINAGYRKIKKITKSLKKEENNGNL